MENGRATADFPNEHPVAPIAGEQAALPLPDLFPPLAPGGRADALKTLLQWRADNPLYDGDDPRAQHYRARLSALDAAIVALAGAGDGSDNREDAERWRAFASSARFKMIGSANFDHSAYPAVSVKPDIPPGDWLHFGLEVWDRHPVREGQAGYEQGVHGRNLLMAYVEHRRAELAAKAPATGFDEQHGEIYGADYADRSVKRSHRAEGRNYVD